MDGTEADRRAAAVDVVPVVVGVCDMQVTLIFISVAVRVADQRCFPLLQLVNMRPCEEEDVRDRASRCWKR